VAHQASAIVCDSQVAVSNQIQQAFFGRTNQQAFFGREHRMVGDNVLDAELAEPTIGKVHLHLGADTPLRADRKHVADDQHPDHEHRIDRGPTDPGIIGRKLGVDPGQERQQSRERDDRPVPPPQGRTNKTAVPARG
jgi:hypothetical protein